MRVAIIDLGTNTFNLLIADLNAGKTYSKLYNTRISVKLGEETINTGFISGAPFQRGLEAMSQLQAIIREHNVDRTLAFATSAIRSASNGKDFTAAVQERTGIIVEVIDGDREAELIYYGNRMAVSMHKSCSMIMDIGGGSTEFILANGEKMFWAQSFLLGAARLLERFQPSNPITEKERESIDRYLREELKDLMDATEKYQPTELIGSSGAFDSLVDMIAARYDQEGMDGLRTEYDVDREQCRNINNIVIHSTLAERRNIRGLVEMRVDMMVISSIFIEFILNTFNINTLRVSTYSLKEGVLYELINAQA